MSIVILGYQIVTLFILSDGKVVWMFPFLFFKTKNAWWFAIRLSSSVVSSVILKNHPVPVSQTKTIKSGIVDEIKPLLHSPENKPDNGETTVWRCISY